MPKNQRYITEARTLEKSGSTYRICVIDEGVGSSAVYPRELFAEESPIAFTTVAVFDKVKSHFDHLEPWQDPSERKVLSIAGKLVGTPTVEEHDGKLGLWSDFEPRREYEEFFEQFHDVIGMSIYAGAIIAEERHEPTGLPVVEQFVRDPYTSVDVVCAAGRGGRFDEATESLRVIRESFSAPKQDAGKTTAEASADGEKEEKHMEEKLDKLIEAIASLTTQLTPVIESATKTATEAEAAATAEEAVDKYASQVEAIDKAELLPTQAERLKRRAKSGEDVADAIAEAKADKEAALKAVAESAAGSKAPATSIVFESKPGSEKEDWSL